MANDDWFTPREEALMDAVEKYELKYACRTLEPPMSYSTARVTMHHIRQKILRSMNTVNRALARRRRDPRLGAMLTPVRKVPVEIALEKDRSPSYESG